MEEAIISNISGFGFPAILCFYLIFKIDKTLEKLTEAINNLNVETREREERTQAKIDALQKAYDELKYKIESRTMA